MVGGKWDKMMDVSRRVYSTETIAPTLHTCGGGNLEAKIMEEPRFCDLYNRKEIDGKYCGTLTTGTAHNGCGTFLVQEEYNVYNGKNAKEINNNCAGTILTNSNFTGNGVFWVQNKTDCRVRKLTEKECFRLQGVKDEDFDHVKKHQSKSSLYHLAGDSITTSVLMALFGEMLGIDWRSKVDDLAEDLSKERNIKNDTH